MVTGRHSFFALHSCRIRATVAYQRGCPKVAVSSKRTVRAASLMVEVSHMIESAFRESQASLRKAAARTISRMNPQTTLRELLDSEAGTAVRSLSLREFMQALSELSGREVPSVSSNTVKTALAATPTRRVVTADRSSSVSEQERVYRGILSALETGSRSISELASEVDVEQLKLRQYLRWMEENGKIGRTGKARGTRYHLPGRPS